MKCKFGVAIPAAPERVSDLSAHPEPPEVSVHFKTIFCRNIYSGRRLQKEIGDGSLLCFMYGAHLMKP